ncbi:MAG: translocation/assembly module TamB domain-containing protein, partial [Flavobacteriales bacterium]|nr:translocation/assembly module TamB domain-containing protein [Flavobacteriales bacterium]
RLKTASGTRFALPLDGASDASYASFIHFNKPLTASEDAQRVTPDLSRFRVDLNIEVTEDAVARIIFDESVGDEIMGVTTGDLAIKINDFEQINMNGQLEVVKGSYFFTLQNLINKQFDIEPGGTISWFGDPYEAEINLNTLYAVRTNLEGLLPDEDNLPGRIPVNLNLELQGALMRPNIGFSIDLPEASPQLKTLVEGALINEEELNRQALSLLVLNQFLSPDPITSGIGGENMQDKSTAFIASQLGHWISQISPDMDIGFDYATDPTRGEQALAVALSTRLLDDRLHVEGAIGTDQLREISTQNVQLQDMTLSYDLDENGNFQVTGHTRQNPEWSSPDGATTQGVGLRFQREFNTWGERRKKREASLNEEL